MNFAANEQLSHGIPVGGQRSLLLGHGHSDCQKIADVSDVDVGVVSGNAFSCRSVWKSSHGYGGLLYREQEYEVIVREGQGEAIGHVAHIFAHVLQMPTLLTWMFKLWKAWALLLGDFHWSSDQMNAC